MRKNFSQRARGLGAAVAFAIAATCGHGLLAAETSKAAAAAPPLRQSPETSGRRESDAHGDPRLAWWRDARFGMFIHWGLYAQDGCFWRGQDGKSEHMMRHLQIPIAEYEKIANDFNPVKFNAKQWVRIAKAAGMKYMIITAKHHDGFAMYDSKCDSFNIVARTPFKRDPVKELAAACRAQGLRFGVYYSLGRDWHDPDVPTRDGYRSNTWDFPDEDKKVFSRYFERKVKPQVTELLSNYGPIAVLWFDTPEKISKAESEELVALVHKLQPACIVNARVGNHLGDYAVQEQKIPEQGDPKPWETCMTLNSHWGYHKLDTKWKPTQTLVQHLADVASKGGNFLLNVGPTGEGLIPAPSVERLKAVGQWLKVNGEGIYGTTAGPFKKLPWGCCTKKASKKGTILYLHVFERPLDGRLLVPGLRSEVQSAVLLGTHGKLATAAAPDGVIVTLAKVAPDSVCPTVALRIKGGLTIQ